MFGCKNSDSPALLCQPPPSRSRLFSITNMVAGSANAMASVATVMRVARGARSKRSTVSTAAVP
jgi:hypothetical protein